MVGEDLNGCAFVYGSLSFLDKISCGIALFALESYEGKRRRRCSFFCVFSFSAGKAGN